MIGYFIVSAIVLIVALAIFVGASVAIAFHDSENAADIISAMGKSFPLRGVWPWRK